MKLRVVAQQPSISFRRRFCKRLRRNCRFLGHCPPRVRSCSSKSKLEIVVGILGAKVGPLSPHSRSCLVLPETESTSNVRVLSQSGLRLLEVDAAIAVNSLAKLMIPARPVLFTLQIFGPKISSHVVLRRCPLVTELETVTPCEASSRRTPLSSA